MKDLIEIGGFKEIFLFAAIFRLQEEINTNGKNLGKI